MIVCINCSHETKDRMDSLLNNSNYRDYSELIAVAIDNLLVLDREVAAKGALVIGENHPLLQVDEPTPRIPKAQPATDAKPSLPSRPPKTASAAPPPDAPMPLAIPDLFLAGGLDGLSVATLNIQPKKVSADETFTLDRWLFGQYNKLLPVKANGRALARLCAEQPEGAPVEDTARRIAEAAMLLGDYLADYDRHHQIGRDDALATAFPRSGPEAEKSLARYANQFVGSVNSQHALSGLLWDYRLAGLASGNGPRLLLTDQGIKLARLSNPVLDGCQTAPAQKFSPEEVSFLLDHIRAFVPVEAFAFRTLIQAISAGADTPDKLDEALRSLVPTNSNRSLSPSFLTSQRSGALSRMADLGLIARVRRGVKVSYTITHDGEAFMANTGNNTEKENG